MTVIESTVHPFPFVAMLTEPDPLKPVKVAYDATAPTTTQGFTRILVTEPEHPYVAAWWPPGHGLGYEHSFTHEMRDLIHGIAEGTDPRPTFADGFQVQRVLDAIRRVRRAHLGEGAATLAIGQRCGEKRRRDDAADQDQKHAPLHRRYEPSHGALSLFTSAVRT